jgi:hypothetical protein
MRPDHLPTGMVCSTVDAIRSGLTRVGWLFRYAIE